VLKEATDARTGPSEVAALEEYLKANSPLTPRTPERIRRAY
jgi:hypothetical protein